MVVPNNLEKLSNKKKETENKNLNHTHLSNQSNDSETTNETNYKSREPNVFSFKNKITKDNDNREDTKHHTSEEYKQHKRPNSNKSNDGNNENNFELYSPKQFSRKEREVYVFKVESQHNESTQSELEFVIYIPVNP